MSVAPQPQNPLPGQFPLAPPQTIQGQFTQMASVALTALVTGLLGLVLHLSTRPQQGGAPTSAAPVIAPAVPGTPPSPTKPFYVQCPSCRFLFQVKPPTTGELGALPAEGVNVKPKN